MSVVKRKSERIDVRVTASAKETLQHAASLSHRNVSEFLLDAGLLAAADTLADRRLFTLDDAAWLAFQEVLDRPVKHKPRLAKLLSEPSEVE